MKTLKTFLQESVSQPGVYPWYLKDITPDKAYNSVSTQLLSNYNNYLTTLETQFKKTKDESLAELEKTKNIIQKIQSYNLKELKEELSIDVKTNKNILKNIIKENSEYINYIKTLLQTTKLTESKNTFITELNIYYKNSVPNIISTYNQSLKLYKKQYAALIDPENLPEPVIKERVGAKLNLLKRRLGELEESIEYSNEMLIKINTQRDNILEATKILSK